MYNQYDIDNFNNETNKKNEFKNKFNNYIFINNIDKLKINDIVIIEYYPYSQKYIYNLYPKFGKIINILNLELYNDDILSIIILQNNNEIYNASHGQYNMYNRGYDYDIIKIQNPNL